MEKIWANSGDSHLVEPDNLFSDSLPAPLAAGCRAVSGTRTAAGRPSTWTGSSFARRLPTRDRRLTDELGRTVPERAPGANDPALRLLDLDEEGIWAELIYPSLGIWTSSIRDPELLAAGARAINDWAIEFQATSPALRVRGGHPVPDHGVGGGGEVVRAASMGFHAGVASREAAALTATTGTGSRGSRCGRRWRRPAWSSASTSAANPMRPMRPTASTIAAPGGALLNYMETTYGGQRAVAMLIAGGVFDRHPTLRAIVSEGGATWGPFVADRLDEAYRQHAPMVRPRLARLPSEYLYENVYASFQHDRSAVAAVTAMGWRNVCWGADYPHTEGTFGHTQKTLEELFGDLDPDTRHRITQGAFRELFPHVPPAPGS